jgi:filamentous hemagglutinin
MMQRIGFSPEEHTKKLGDGFYEQRLVTEQILKQAGKAFLDRDIKSQQDQYTSLMDNAVKMFENFQGSELELVPGIALTKAQIEALTSDIVWMEEKIVNNQIVLVPQVYLANSDAIEISDGMIVASEDINLQVQTLINKATLEANDDITLNATNDITNISGNIQATNINLTSLNGDIINKRDSKAIIGEAGEIKATNNLAINTNENFNNIASNLEAKNLLTFANRHPDLCIIK